MFRPLSFVIALGSYTIWQSPCVNLPVNSTEQDELAGTQAPAKRFNASNNKAFTPPETLIPFETPTLPLVPSPAKDLFTKFIKVFMEMTQTQALTKPKELLLKTRTLETYWYKFHMEYYHFYQLCEDHFKTLSVIEINCTPFVASFLYGSISIRWAQHKYRHKSTTPITWTEFKAFL